MDRQVGPLNVNSSGMLTWVERTDPMGRIIEAQDETGKVLGVVSSPYHSDQRVQNHFTTWICVTAPCDGERVVRARDAVEAKNMLANHIQGEHGAS